MRVATETAPRALINAMERQVRDLQDLANEMADATEAARLDSCIDAIKRQIAMAAAHGPGTRALLGFDRGND